MPDVLTHRPTDATSPTPGPAFAPVRDPASQELATTASRQLRRADDFRAAAHFMVTAGFHPKAGRTTLRLAEVFATRMRRSRHGHFPFSVQTTARELGLKPRAVMYHARYLRELGLLAYAEHGSKTNVLRTRRGAAWRPGDGYRGTATLFAATAPAVWDEAMGRRIAGTGYTARIAGVTDHGRVQATRQARREAAAKTPARRTSCTPSVAVPQDYRQLKVVGGEKDTSRQRATCPKTSPRTSSNTNNRPRVTPAECARAITVAERLQREVWWLHRGCARRLGYVLRPLIANGWTWQSLTGELLTWGVPGHLRDPAAYVRHELTRRQQLGSIPGLTPRTMPDDQVDDAGTRYAAMLRVRQDRNTPIWQRYAEQLRPALRQRLADGRQAAQDNRRRRTENQPRLRESEQTFTQSLPTQSLWGEDVSSRDIYRARVAGLPGPVRPAAPDTGLGWLVHLRDQHEAERACAALRIELEDWAVTQCGAS